VRPDNANRITMTEDKAPTWDDMAILEALLFASAKPLSMGEMQELTGWKTRFLEESLDILTEEYAHRGINIRQVGGGYQMVTSPRAAKIVEKLQANAARSTLSRAALETLAIIAYKQPVTRAQVEALRGVKVDRIISQLFERNFIRETGRSDAPGRPALLGTTRHFLTWFGLKSLDDLPPLPDLDALDTELPAAFEQANEGKPAEEPSGAT
jgi:segregation and condensation protein B